MGPLNYHKKILIIIDITNIKNSENVNSLNVFKTKISAAQKKKFSIKDSFSKCEQIHRKLTEEILKWKTQFLYSLVMYLLPDSCKPGALVFLQDCSYSWNQLFSMTIAINNQLIHLKQHCVLDYNFGEKRKCCQYQLSWKYHQAWIYIYSLSSISYKY